VKPASAIPLLLSALVGVLLGLVSWGVLQLHRRTYDAQLASHDGALLALLALAAFALGAFVTYALLSLGW
jgi:hypothetical protein